MLDKLAQLAERFEAINRRLADPTVAQDQSQLRELGKEHAELEPIVAVYHQLRDVERDLLGAREIIEADKADNDAELVEMAQEELRELGAKAAALRHQARVLLTPKDPNDAKNALLEIRAGTGGDEASLFVGDLLRMYTSFAEDRGFRVEMLSASTGTKGGFKEVIALIQGKNVFSTFKFESGVHRVQRVPATETQGRIHTSAVTVAVMPEAEEVDLDIRDQDLRIDVYRSSGPGGQSVNTTDSAVRITHLPTGLVVICQDEKSQHKNRAKALRILRSRILDKMQAEEDAKRAEQRRDMVKTGDRSEKIRTYNFPQDRLTDHRIGLTVHNLPGILSGNLKDVVSALQTHYQSEALRAGDARETF